jgi:hypothetical protein
LSSGKGIHPWFCISAGTLQVKTDVALGKIIHGAVWLQDMILN